MKKGHTSLTKERFLQIARVLNPGNQITYSLREIGLSYATFSMWRKKGTDPKASFLFKKLAELYTVYQFGPYEKIDEIIAEVESSNIEDIQNNDSVSVDEESIDFSNAPSTVYLVEWKSTDKSLKRIFAKKSSAEKFLENINLALQVFDVKANLSEMEVHN